MNMSATSALRPGDALQVLPLVSRARIRPFYENQECSGFVGGPMLEVR